MLSQELKNEWLEKIKKINQYNVNKDGRHFTIRTEFYEAPEEVRLDEEMTWKVLLESQECLWNIHEKFKGNKEFILKLINMGEVYKGQIYKGCSRELKEDPEIFSICMKRGDPVDGLWDIPQSIMNNKELLLKTLPDRNIFPQIYETYKYDKEINLLTMRHYPEYFHKLKKRMINYVVKDEEALKKIVKHYKNYQYLPDKVKLRLDIIDLALQASYENFQYIPENIRKDKDVILYGISRFNVPLRYIDKDIMDQDIAIHAIEKNDYNTTYLTDNLKDNEAVMSLAVEKNGEYLKYASLRLKDNKNLVLRAIEKSGSPLKYASASLRDNVEVIKKALETKKSIQDLNLGSNSLNNDELAKIMVQNLGENYQFLSEELKDKKEIILLAIKSSPLSYQYVKGIQRLDWEIINETLKRTEDGPNNISKLKIVDLIPIEIFPEEIQKEAAFSRFKALLSYASKKSLEIQLERQKENVHGKKLKL